MVHIKSMRWLILNRIIEETGGTRITLSKAMSCYGGTCQGWGYFINNAMAAMDQDGECYYDENEEKVYLCSSDGPPSNIEGSVILSEETRGAGGILLGSNASPIEHVIVENFEVKNWFANGITTPASMRHAANGHLVIRNNTVRDVDDTGLRLISWINGATSGQDCHRGGHDLQIYGNTIDGANHFGIDTFSINSVYHHNVIKNIGLIENLGKSGLGCGYSGSSCTENGDGIRVRGWNLDYAGFNNCFRYNEIKKTGYNGMDIFGAETVIENNKFSNVCCSKGDCGAIRTFGDTGIDATRVHDIVIRENIIVESIAARSKAGE